MSNEIIFSGLEIEGYRNTGRKSFDIYFGVPVGHEDLAATDILSCLANGFEVNLRNDLDEDLEGLTMLRMTQTGFEIRIGGHGWSRSWKPVDEVGVVETVKNLLPLNRGGHWHTRGLLSKTVE